MKRISASAFADRDVGVDAPDPLRLKAETAVELFPTDGGGFTHEVRQPLLVPDSKRHVLI